jgi:hypothetical protein
MSITINGSGTITGISAGGLPDGSITNDDLAGSITDAKLSGTTCKAFVNFNGTGTVAIRAQFNVSSITDNGTGLYTVNFATALADADYAMVASGSDAGSGPTTYVQEGTRLTTACPVRSLQRDGNVRDDANFQCAFFR